jgi:single-strand DNA-binding protein
MNVVTLTGRWTKDIEVKEVGSYKVGRSTLAVDDGYGDKKQTYFFEVEMWNKLAENVEKYSAKGRKILIHGKLKQDSYEKDGQRKFVIKVAADTVEFLDSPKDSMSKLDIYAPPPHKNEDVVFEGDLPF